LEKLEPVKSGKVKVNGVNLYYELYGEGDPLVRKVGDERPVPGKMAAMAPCSPTRETERLGPEPVPPSRVAGRPELDHVGETPLVHHVAAVKRAGPASRILGATRLRALRDVTAPLLRTSVIATWCFIFVAVIRELSAAIILFTSQTKVVSVLIFDLKESGDLGAIAVIGLCMLAITFAVVILVNRIPGFGNNLRRVAG